MSIKTSAGFGVIVKRALACLDLATWLVIPVIAVLMHITTMGSLPGAIMVLPWLLYIGVWTLFLSYGLSAVHGISDGVKEVGVGSQYRARYSTGLHGLVLLLPAGVLVYLTRGIEPLLFKLLVDAVVLFWLPASLLILARTGSWVAALNPPNITKAIAGLGLDYWKVLIVSDLMIGLTLSLRGEIISFLFHICLMAALLASFALLGAAAYTRRRQLGQESMATETLAEVGKRETAPTEHEFVRQSKIIEREQGLAAAVEFLGGELKQLFAPPPVHEYHLRLLQRAGRKEQMLELGREMIQRYLEDQKTDAALNVARACLDAEPDFCLQHLEKDDLLIERAIGRGRNELVIKLCRSYIKQFGRYRRSVDHSITAARLLNERYADPVGARELLLDAVKRGAADQHLVQVQAMLKAMD